MVPDELDELEVDLKLDQGGPAQQTPTKPRNKREADADDPDSAACSGRKASTTSAKKAKTAAKSPCKVCGLVFGDMPSNSAYCWEHKRAVESLATNLKGEGRKKGTNNYESFLKIRDTAGDPPSQFSKMVQEYLEQAPSSGRGVRRNKDSNMDMLQLLQKYNVTTGLTKDFVCIMMHKERWLKHATESMMVPADEAEAQWEETKASTKEEDTDKKGPKGALRLPMHCDDRLIGSESVELSKEMSFESKKRKITSEQQIEDAQDQVAEKQVNFNNKLFKSVGGESASALVRRGQSWAGGAGSASSTDGCGFNVVVAGEAKSKVKKEYDIALQRVKLSAEFSEKASGVSEKIKAALERCEDIKKQHLVDGGAAAAPGAAARQDLAPNHKRYMDIMENRRMFLAAVAISVEEAPKIVLSAGAKKAKELADLAKLRLALEKLIGDGDKNKDKYKGNLIALQDTLRDVKDMPYADLLASRAGISLGEVKEDMTLIKRMREDLNLVDSYLKVWVHINDLAQKCIEEKRPLPAASAECLPPIIQLTLIAQFIDACEAEDDIKTTKNDFATTSGHIEKLCKSVEVSCKEVESNIKIHQKRQAAAIDKESKKKEADAERKKKEESNAALAAMKKRASGQNKVEKPDNNLLDFEHPVFQDMRVFDGAGFEAMRQGKTSAKESQEFFEPGAPYIVTGHKGMHNLTEDRSIKAALGIFRIQFHKTKQAREDLRGQTPFVHDKRDEVREMLMGIAPPRNVQVSATLQGAAHGKAVTAITMFGCSVGMNYQGLDRYGMASMRYQVNGERDVAVLTYPHLMDYASAMGMQIGRSDKLSEYTDSILGTLCNPDAFSKFKECGGTIWRGVVKPGDTNYTPLGSIIVERTLGSNPAFGIRACLLPSSATLKANFDLLRESADQADGADSTLVRFWERVASLYDAASERAAACFEARPRRTGTASATRAGADSSAFA